METLQISSEQMRRQLSDLLSQVAYGGAQIVIERYGKPIAVLSPYPQPSANEEQRAEIFAPMERVPQLAHQIERAVHEAGLTYETIGESLQAERLRTLREKYPDFTERYVPSESA